MRSGENASNEVLLNINLGLRAEASILIRRLVQVIKINDFDPGSARNSIFLDIRDSARDCDEDDAFLGFSHSILLSCCAEVALGSAPCH